MGTTKSTPLSPRMGTTKSTSLSPRMGTTKSTPLSPRMDTTKSTPLSPRMDTTECTPFTPDELDNYIPVGDNGSVYLFVKPVKSKDSFLTYVDTTEQEMMYDPKTTAGINLSVHTILTQVSLLVYTISNEVLPDNTLQTTTITTQDPSSITYQIEFVENSATQFTRLDNPDKTGTFAFYTLIDNDPEKRAYLQPVTDPIRPKKRSTSIQAVQSAQSADGKYFFSFKA